MTTASTVTFDIDPTVLLAQPPQTIGRFRVITELGRGANGVVYAAHDPVLGRDVAIKAIPLTVDDKVRARAEANFIKEARAVAGLSHPHIVTVFDAGRTDTLAYIAMERLHGRDLHEFLHSGVRPSLRQAAALMARIADAVHYAHKRGLIHRDIKPSNIFLTRDMRPKVLDFGVAMPRSQADPLGRSRLVGTPNYMSPEQAQGLPLDARSDVFSLGAILYEMVTGQRAFDAPTTEEVLQRLIDREPTPVAQLRPDAPAELLRIIGKAMAKDVEARYQTAGELRNDLAAFAGAAEMEGGARRPPEPPRVSRRRAAWAAALSLVAVATAMVLWQGGRDGGSSAPPAPEAAAAAPPTAPANAEAPPAEPSAVTAAAAPAVAPAAPPSRAERAPPREGHVTLAIAPWGEVVVNGEVRGVSPPLTELHLPPGKHTVEVRNADFPPLKTNIEVEAGKTRTLRHRF